VFPCGAPPVVAGRAIGAVAGTRYGTAAVRRRLAVPERPIGNSEGERTPRARPRGRPPAPPGCRRPGLRL